MLFTKIKRFFDPFFEVRRIKHQLNQYRIEHPEPIIWDESLGIYKNTNNDANYTGYCGSPLTINRKVLRRWQQQYQQQTGQ